MQIEIHWHDEEARGWVDVLPLAVFAKDAVGEERVHIVRGPRKGVHHARYRLHVSQSKATLDYTAYPEFNKRKGMTLGTMDIIFTNASRRRIQQLWWKKKKTSAKQATIRIVRDGLANDEPVVKAQKHWAKQLLREGQVEFRKRLIVAYGAKCCISKCPVVWCFSRSAHSAV